MYELEPYSNIVAYVSSSLSENSSQAISQKDIEISGGFFNYLENIGTFKSMVSKEFTDEILNIFYWFLEENNTEPSISEIEIEYKSRLLEDVINIGEALNEDRREIYGTIQAYMESDFGLFLEDNIKEVLNRYGLSPIYMNALGDEYLLIVKYFGAQTFMDDVLNNLLIRRCKHE